MEAVRRVGTLTIQEVIEHCERHVKGIERNLEMYRDWLELEPMTTTVKRYLEHKQTAEWLKELQHYKDLEEQGYKMVNINKIVAQLEDVSCYIEDRDGHAGHLVFTDEAIEIVKEGAE